MDEIVGQGKLTKRRGIDCLIRDKQHTAFHLAMGGLYPCPEVIEAVLAPSGAEPKRIIDIGKLTSGI